MPSTKKKNKLLGTCYESSLRFIMESADLQIEGYFTLVHGTVYSPSLKKRIGHAWVEVGDVVIDPAQSLSWRKEKYYRIGKVKICNRYSALQAMKMAVKFEHFGPWQS